MSPEFLSVLDKRPACVQYEVRTSPRSTESQGVRPVAGLAPLPHLRTPTFSSGKHVVSSD